jgi:hypothetical protein
MSFDLLVRQQRRTRRKSCRLSRAMTRMTTGQFWQQRGVASSDEEEKYLTRAKGSTHIDVDPDQGNPSCLTAPIHQQPQADEGRS